MNNSLRKYKNRIPNYLLDRIAKWKYSPKNSSFLGKDIKGVFESIYQNNHWGSSESISGQGSSKESSLQAKKTIEAILRNYPVESVLDIPCGDFNWMKEVDLKSVKYLGYDIVKELIQENQKLYQKENIHFHHKDITKDALAKVDLVIARDLFVHFNYATIFKGLEAIKQSESKYLLTTTFTAQTINYDIQTGDWRPINLILEPFNLPKPLKVFEESYHPDFKKEARGKSLALWEIKNL